VQARFSIQFRKLDGSELLIDERPQMSFTEDLVNVKGPCVGDVLVSTAGTDIDLSQMTEPGWCILFNRDPTNYVEVGIWDPERLVYTPFGELRPLRGFPVFLTRFFGVEYTTPGTGTGTTGHTNRLRLKANTAACTVSVKAFDR
jgi:hypothetical protein